MKADTITDERQIEALEAYLKSNSQRDYVIFKIGTNLGLRVSDYLDMPKDERKARKKAGLPDYYTVGYFREMCKRGRVRLTQQKTDKPVDFEMPGEIKKLILEYAGDRPDNAPMFPSRMGGKALTRIGFFLILKEAANAVGIEDINISCHTMRKVFGYFHYKKNKDIRLLMSIFNHSKEEVTLVYIGESKEEIDKSTKELVIGSFDQDKLDSRKDEMQKLKKKYLAERKNKKKIGRYD